MGLVTSAWPNSSRDLLQQFRASNRRCTKRNRVSRCSLPLPCLILHRSLPYTREDEHQSHFLVSLPNLSELQLVGDVIGCDIVIRSISFPPNVRVMLRCLLDVLLPPEFPQFLSNCGAYLGSGSSIGHFCISVDLLRGIRFQAWTPEPLLDLSFGALS
jgi:hypothetical protein